MANDVLLARLEAIRLSMMAKYHGGQGMSSVTTGAEREAFNQGLLEMVVAPPFRVGAGEVTDAYSRQSGPLDLVIEHSGSLSFPMEAGGRRLYMAEGVAAVIEVKSTLPSQWAKAVEEARKVAALRKSMLGSISFGPSSSEAIPVIVAGFIGWEQVQTYDEKIREPSIDGILSLEPPVFRSKSGFGGTGTPTLLAFFAHLQSHMKATMAVIPNYTPYGQ